MVVPVNINLDKEGVAKFKDFVTRNRQNIEAIYMPLYIEPFKPTNFKDEELQKYYQYVASISKQFKLNIIGIFDEDITHKYKDNMEQIAKKFTQEFQKFYNQGIKIICRPYDWIDYKFQYFFKDITYFLPRDSNAKMMNRIYNKDVFWSYLDYLENGIQSSLNPYEDLIPKDEKEVSEYQKRFSIAHPDASSRGYLFYQAIKNATPKFRSEIDDIYFGKEFIYDDGFTYLKYGGVMGTSASDEQIDYLFKIQDEFGIDISLTLNTMIHPPELLHNKKILNSFIAWLQKFYKRGLRSCTISNVHLMKLGVLQHNFPEMKWKNTVNHLIKDAQSFLNYTKIGYDYIQLDRSLSRNIDELKKISKLNQKLEKPKKLYMLVTEHCMQDCPFKHEHDMFNTQVGGIGHKYFQSTDLKQSHISCDRWRFGGNGELPRVGVNYIPKDKEQLDKYLEYVDVFKISGRMMVMDQNYVGEEFMLAQGYRGDWSFEKSVKNAHLNQVLHIYYHADIRNKLPTEFKENIYDTKEGKHLLEVLSKCNNQCYDCHLCEKTFGIEPIDSFV